MTKEDLVIEFHKKIDKVEKEFFDNIVSRRKAQDELWDNFYREYEGNPTPNNTNPEYISVPFYFEFYIKGHRCKIAQRFEIVVYKDQKYLNL